MVSKVRLLYFPLETSPEKFALWSYYFHRVRLIWWMSRLAGTVAIDDVLNYKRLSYPDEDETDYNDYIIIDGYCSTAPSLAEAALPFSAVPRYSSLHPSILYTENIRRSPFCISNSMIRLNIMPSSIITQTLCGQ